MRYRRSHDVVFHWHGNELTAANYRRRNFVALEPLAARVLGGFGDWREAERVVRSIPDHSPGHVLAVIEALVEAGLLHGEDDDGEQLFRRAWGRYDETARCSTQHDRPGCDAHTLAALLHWTFAPAPSGTSYQLRSYVAVFDVPGAHPGLYRYRPEAQVLQPLPRPFDRTALHEVSLGAGERSATAFACFVTAAVPPTRYHRPHRIAVSEAVHRAHTFAVTATALGLAAWQSAAFHDELLASRLGADGFTERAIYMFGISSPGTATGRTGTGSR
ncbi:hypothetical protein NDR87_03080 [Nocardia sp. CDC159]|uniref:SagB-type dehydrogenase family enzyme n=1 Tax=Nocardia pulmonis TaxID=2951408 RepID=A0A9X2E5K5_9NOCA|nr:MULTISPECIES: hypothetical protein [Nocardia]MCM6772003.1 hypothetical protein [Nocardia pulmonis]MCM6785339.1 hypothetical protein [Nocardia sp. CDC159]